MKPCFGYVRVSTQKQGEGVSLEAQREAILSYAARQNLRITEWFEEKETAAKSGRPVFLRMLRLLEQGKAAGLIIHKIDRSARNLKDWAVLSDLSDAGIDVYFATESLDFRSRGGRLTADIQAVIAADFIRNLRDETKKGLTGRLKQGLYPFKAPIGYLDNGRGKPKTICPVKGPLVRRAFALYASGTHSIRSLQAELTRQGLRNHQGRPLCQHAVEAMLRNTFYCGLITIVRTGETYLGVHEPLIDVRTFSRVEDVKSGRAGKKVTRHNHLYRGLFRCALCQASLSPERQKGRVYYRCQTRTCPTKTIREDMIDAKVADALRQAELTSDDAARLRTQLRAWLTAHPEEAEKDRLKLQIANAEARHTRLTDLLIDGTLSRNEYNERKRDLALELTRLNDDLAKVDQNALADDDVEKFLELGTSLVALHEIANPAEKREMVQNYFSNRVLTPENLVLEPQNWLLEAKMCGGVPDGDHYRPTSRTEHLASTIKTALAKLQSLDAPVDHSKRMRKPPSRQGGGTPEFDHLRPTSRIEGLANTIKTVIGKPLTTDAQWTLPDPESDVRSKIRTTNLLLNRPSNKVPKGNATLDH